MAAVSFGDAAAYLGHKSRSTLYRLKRGGWLKQYLRPGGKGGADLLELEPPGLPPLFEHVRGILKERIDSPTRQTAESADRIERRRWAMVASELTAAAAYEGCPVTLGPEAAQAIVTALPDALAVGWGLAAVEQLAAEAQALAQAMQPPPTLHQPADGSAPFWAEYGRIAGPDEPPLTDDEAEDNAARMVAGLLGCPTPGTAAAPPRFWLWDLERLTAEARHDVAAGARWDVARWDAANVRSLLPYLPDCELSRAEMRELLEAGRVPAELLAEVEAALAQPLQVRP